MPEYAAVRGSLTLIRKEEVGEQPAHADPPPVNEPPPSLIFTDPVTAMCAVNTHTMAIACGSKLYFVKVQ